MHLKNPKDFWAGVMFAAIGIGFAVVVKVNEYPMGTAGRMGAGFFPFYLGLLLAILGVAIIIESLATEGGPVGKLAWKPLFWVLGAVVLFGLIAKIAGLMLSIVVLVGVAAFGGHEFKWKEALLLGVGLAVFCYFVFLYGLKLPFPVWPAFIEG
ncbi:MAG: tripartite tricarboxylate transporter TctB family protein [Betaproteobacteria bacterium]|nr:tripartite tricarboxylate transporter TctB family protein [Betaproteobacteria bacterium]